MSQVLSYSLGGPMAGRYYHHSGKVTFHGVALAAAVGLPAAIILGVVYAYADIYIPIIYLNLLVCAGFGLGMAFLCGKVLTWGKVRNVPVSLAIIGVLTAIAYYVCWIAWVWGTLSRGETDELDFTPTDLVLHPNLLWALIQILNRVGTWSIGNNSYSSSSHNDSNISGVALWVVWFIEAGLIFGAAFVLGRKLTGDRPFCEACERWTDKPRMLATLALGDAKLAKSTVEAGNYGYLQERRQTPSLNPWWQLDYRQCAGCDRFYTLTLNLITKSIDKKGKESLSTKAVIDRLIVSAEQLQVLSAMMGVMDPTKLPPLPVATPPPVPTANPV